MKTRKLRNIEVSEIGYGCMGFSHGYGELPPKEDAIRLIRMAYEMGCTHFDTAEGYGAGATEELVGEALAPMAHLSRVILLESIAVLYVTHFAFPNHFPYLSK